MKAELNKRFLSQVLRLRRRLPVFIGFIQNYDGRKMRQISHESKTFGAVLTNDITKVPTKDDGMTYLAVVYQIKRKDAAKLFKTETGGVIPQDLLHHINKFTKENKDKFLLGMEMGWHPEDIMDALQIPRESWKAFRQTFKEVMLKWKAFKFNNPHSKSKREIRTGQVIDWFRLFQMCKKDKNGGSALTPTIFKGGYISFKVNDPEYFQDLSDLRFSERFTSMGMIPIAPEPFERFKEYFELEEQDYITPNIKLEDFDNEAQT